MDSIEHEEIELMSSEEILSKGQDIEQNILFYWDDFLEFKKLISRNPDTIKRYNSLATTLVKFWEKYHDNGYDQLGLKEVNIHFFIDFIRYMIKRTRVHLLGSLTFPIPRKSELATRLQIKG